MISKGSFEVSKGSFVGGAGDINLFNWKVHTYYESVVIRVWLED